MRTTSRITPKGRRARARWVLPALWIAATSVAEIVYAIPVGAVHFVMGLDRLDDPSHVAEIGAGMLVLAAVLCGAAIGATIGLAQWLVLGRELRQMGRWVAATLAGYAAIGLLPLLAGAFQPGWLTWALSLILNGKMHWLARVEPVWPAAAWLPGAVTLSMFGLVLGLAQWLVLRGHVHQAGWWIAISTISWALPASLSSVPSPVLVVLATGFLPGIVTGVGMAWLVGRSDPARQSSLNGMDAKGGRVSVE